MTTAEPEAAAAAAGRLGEHGREVGHTVRYVGGELDGHVLTGCPAVFAEHGQREVTGSDGLAHYYRRRGMQDGEHVFVFESASEVRRLDDEQEPLDAPGVDA